MNMNNAVKVMGQNLVNLIGKFSVTKWSSWNTKTMLISNSTLKLFVDNVGQVNNLGNIM